MPDGASELGKPTKTYTFDEAAEICGVDPDHSKRDLYETIEKGGEFKWTLCVQASPFSQGSFQVSAYRSLMQIMTPEEVLNVDFDPFDVTKVWPRGQFPLHEVGKLTLNRNVEGEWMLFLVP